MGGTPNYGEQVGNSASHDPMLGRTSHRGRAIDVSEPDPEIQTVWATSTLRARRSGNPAIPQKDSTGISNMTITFDGIRLQEHSGESFGNVLSGLHELSEMKATQLSVLAELPREYVWRLEKGDRTGPSRRTVERLSHALMAGPNPAGFSFLAPLYMSVGMFPGFMDKRDLKEPT